MAKRVNHGKTEQILEFIREFCASHGFGPTIREIGRGVGLQSASTVAGYLNRMTRDGPSSVCIRPLSSVSNFPSASRR